MLMLKCKIINMAKQNFFKKLLTSGIIVIYCPLEGTKSLFKEVEIQGMGRIPQEGSVTQPLFIKLYISWCVEAWCSAISTIQNSYSEGESQNLPFGLHTLCLRWRALLLLSHKNFYQDLLLLHIFRSSSNINHFGGGFFNSDVSRCIISTTQRWT